jgi:predicted protein tyrosine phosphatase
MDDAEEQVWAALLEKAKQKIVTQGDDGEPEVLDAQVFFERPVLGKILILPRNAAERFAYPKPWACISISDPRSLFEAEISNVNRVDILRIRFDDAVQNETFPWVLIKPEQGKTIMEFADKVWDKVDLLMIHCNAGLCRSPACGMVISEKYQPAVAPQFKKLYYPNKLVVKTLREVQQGDE